MNKSLKIVAGVAVGVLAIGAVAKYALKNKHIGRLPVCGPEFCNIPSECKDCDVCHKCPYYKEYISESTDKTCKCDKCDCDCEEFE